MKGLTDKEEELMHFFWTHGSLFVKQIVEKHPDPKPHFNTISTFVRALEQKGYVGHEQYGNTYLYHAVVSREEYRARMDMATEILRGKTAEVKRRTQEQMLLCAEDENGELALMTPEKDMPAGAEIC